MPIDTILWDWNGTLLDDAALCCELSQYERSFGSPWEAPDQPGGIP